MLDADWMASAWDQNAVFAELYPGVVAVETLAARWVLEALDLPRESAVRLLGLGTDCITTIATDTDSAFGLWARASLGRAIGYRAAYLPESGDVPDPVDAVVESSRRARGVPVWATLRSLGRSGLADMIDRCRDRAAVRISVSNWRTDVNDIHKAAEAIIAAHASTE